MIGGQGSQVKTVLLSARLDPILCRINPDLKEVHGFPLGPVVLDFVIVEKSTVIQTAYLFSFLDLQLDLKMHSSSGSCTS